MKLKKRILSLMLTLVLLIGVLPVNTFADEGADTSDVPEVAETVTVTVNFVYEHNGAMVTSPWSAQIPKGGEFKTTVDVPAILNFSVDTGKSVLPSGVTYTPGENVADNGTLTFDLASVNEDLDVILYYKPENVDFTVNHYKQKVDSDAYELAEEVKGSGSVQAYAEFAVKEYEGFYCIGKPDVILSGDDAVIDVYYNRHYYTMQFDLDGGINGPAPAYAKYGTQFDLSVLGTPTRTGYLFAGWVDADGNEVTTVTLNGDVTYKAKWSAEAVNAEYKFVIWQQNANDDEYSYFNTITGNAMSGTTVYYKEAKCGLDQHVHSVDAGCYTMNCGHTVEHKHDNNCFKDCTTSVHIHADDCYACVEHDGHTVDCYPDSLTESARGVTWSKISYAEDSLYTEGFGYRLYEITKVVSRNQIENAVTYGNYTIYPNGEVWAASGNPFGSSDSFLKLIDGIWYVVTLNSSDSINYAEYRGEFNVTADSNTVTYVDSYGDTQSLEMNSVPECVSSDFDDTRVMSFYQAILDNIQPGEYTDGSNTYYVASDYSIWGKSKLANGAWFMKKLNGTWYAVTPSMPSTSSASYGWYDEEQYRHAFSGITDCTSADHTHGDGNCQFNSAVCDGNSHAHGDTCCKSNLTEHVHTDSCYTLACLLTEHTHTAENCFVENSYEFDETLWVLKETASGTVEPDGSTVINVYLDRKTYTLDFYYVNSETSTTYENHDSITARWGEDISERYKFITSKTVKQNTKWSQNPSGASPWTNYFGIMPVGGGTYYNSGYATSEGSMYYYGRDLNDNFQLIFQVDYVGGTSVTEEDYFEFEGYTLDKGSSSKVGALSAGAKIYYDRNYYFLYYMNGEGDTNHKVEYLLYQQSLAGYGEKYTPSAPPANSGLESDSEFVGWYKDPEGQVPFDFENTIMPSNNVTVYAKWVNRRYTVTTYLSAETTDLYAYDGYEGSQLVEKYNTPSIVPVDPPATEDGVFMGWYYLDDTQTEQRFSFNMAITKDYYLYPKFTKTYPVEYTVEYKYEDGGELKDAAPSETRTNMFGAEVTELAKTGDDLTYIPAADQGKYFPDATSKTVFLEADDIVITFLYTKPGSVPYKVKYVDVAGNLITEDANGNEIVNPVVKTTDHAIVTETYLPIEGYTPKQYQITQELVAKPDFEKGENTIIFVYGGANGSLRIKKAGVDTAKDGNAPFVFRVTGQGVSMEVVIYGNGEALITDLSSGEYAVEEITGYWRYTLDSSKTATVSGGTDAEVTFTNNRSNDNWLDDFASATNRFGN